MANSLSHTKWVCKYHIVFTPKYRRKIIYYELREDIQKIIKDLCKWEGIEIIEGHMMPDHIHLLLSIAAALSSLILIAFTLQALWHGRLRLTIAVKGQTFAH